MGAARTSHFRSHTKDGSATEITGDDGKLVFKPTGKAPRDRNKEKEEKKAKWLEKQKDMDVGKKEREKEKEKELMVLMNKQTIVGQYLNEPCKNIRAKVGKNNIVSIYCKKCDTPNKAEVSLSDPRFFRTACKCGVITFLTRRSATEGG